jgi:hypothetical protein
VTHDDLARSLADHLRGPERMVWCDMQLGPVGSMRPDVYTLNKSYSRPAPMAYEVKASRADFLADVTAGKWQNYLRVACGVVFACEAGLLTKADVPAHCGLIVRHPSGAWRYAKRAVLSPVTIPEDALLKLVIDGVTREGPAVRRAGWSETAHIDAIKARFGATVARTIRDREAVEYEIASARASAEAVRKRAERDAEMTRRQAEAPVDALRAELCKALGLPETAHRYDIEREVYKLRAAQREHPAVDGLKNAESALRRALQRIEPIVEACGKPLVARACGEDER